MKTNDAKLKLADAIKTNKQKVLDALEEHKDLISEKKTSVAYDLYKHKDDIANMSNYKPLRDLVVDILEKSSQPKAKEYLNKIKYEFDKKVERDPRPNGYNEQYWFNELWQFIYNIMLKAENLGSPDVKDDTDVSLDKAQEWVDYDMKHYGEISEKTNELVKKAGFEIIKDDHGDYEVIAHETHDAGCKDDENDMLRLCKLLGQAHDLVMEAQEIASDLVNTDELPDDVSYDLDDLEAAVSEFEFMGEDNPAKALKEKYGVEDEEEFDEDEDVEEEFDDEDIDDLVLMRENVEEKIHRLRFDYGYDNDLIKEIFDRADVEFTDLTKMSAEELAKLSKELDKEF